VLPLRYPWVWLVLGWALVLLICVGSVVPGDMLPRLNRIDKLYHSGSYFIVMVWFAGFYRRRRYGLIAVTLLVLGMVLELVQRWLGYRDFDLVDMAFNSVGILVGLGLSLWLLGGWCQQIEERVLARIL
jgi:VanZ family protein